MPTIKPITIYRFWQKVAKDSHPNSCWIWMGATARGYGKFKIDSEVFQAHVVSWLIHVGPIPEGSKCLHDCPTGDNRLCVNPAHLWVGSSQDNAKDMVAKGRWNGGARAVKFTEAEIRDIRGRTLAGTPRKVLREEYGISDMALWRICARKTYAYIK